MRTMFGEIGIGGRKRFKCSCGRRVSRQKRFWQRLNPFNKNKDGSVKTQDEILAECRAAYIVWQATVEPCNHIYTRPIASTAPVEREDAK